MRWGENETEEIRQGIAAGAINWQKSQAKKTLCRCFAVLVKYDDEMTTNAKYAPNLHLNWKEKEKQPAYRSSLSSRTAVNIL